MENLPQWCLQLISTRTNCVEVATETLKIKTINIAMAMEFQPSNQCLQAI